MTETPTSVPERAVSSGAPVYRVLARKYRPQTFADLLGQDAMVRTLANAFATGRIAQAYMLTGVRGVGKTTTARLIARALNYTGPGSENGPTIHMTELGEHCAAILESRHVDVIELDAASHTGVDDVREIIEAVRYRPISARYKLYIIDEVHMLSKSAFNALLKTLEEPPPHVKFVFATTEIAKVPITILSRCQRFDLRRLDAGLLMEHFARVARAENVRHRGRGAAHDRARRRRLGARRAVPARPGHCPLRIDDRRRTASPPCSASAIARASSISSRRSCGAMLPPRSWSSRNNTARAASRRRCSPASPISCTGSPASRFCPPRRPTSRAPRPRSRAGLALAGSLPLAALTRAWQLLLKGMTEIQDAADPMMAAEMVLIRTAYGLSLPSSEELVKLAGAPSGPPAAGGPSAAAGASSPNSAPASASAGRFGRDRGRARRAATDGSLALDPLPRQPPVSAAADGAGLPAFPRHRPPGRRPARRQAEG